MAIASTLRSVYGFILGLQKLTPSFSHLANKYLRQYHSHSVEQEVEWLYAFDVHANAFFCSFMVTYVLQVRNCHKNFHKMLTFLFSIFYCHSYWEDQLVLVFFRILYMLLQLYGMRISHISDIEVSMNIKLSSTS